MKLTDANMPVAKALLRQRWPDRATQIELLEVTNDTIICLECFPEDLRVQVTRVQHRKRTVGTMLVGQPAIQWTGGVFKQGTVLEPVASDGGGWVVEWGQGDEKTRETLSGDATVEAVKMGVWLAAPGWLQDNEVGVVLEAD